jgi:uncharacterized protein (DUF1499 family)
MKIVVRIGILLLAACGSGCGGRMPDGLGADRGLLEPCPHKPNCVSSFATDEGHRIAALAIEGSTEAAWRDLRELIQHTPRVEIVTSTPNYMHAVYTSALMRYRDDVEFLLRPDENEIAVRSASRVGHGDMGVNRDRIEAIRSALAQEGRTTSTGVD